MVAKYNVAIMYTDGRGIPKDETKATEWYLSAADQGYLLAQSTLGLRYKAGLGVQRDMVQALKWLILAVDRGDARARKDRDVVAEKMTPRQIQEAEKLAREWNPSAR